MGDVNTLTAQLKACPPQVFVDAFRTIVNGWATSRRLHLEVQGHCIWRCNDHVYNDHVLHYSECEIFCHVLSHELALVPARVGFDLFGLGESVAIGRAASAGEAYRVCSRLPGAERCPLLRK